MSCNFIHSIQRSHIGANGIKSNQKQFKILNKIELANYWYQQKLKPSYIYSERKLYTGMILWHNVLLHIIPYTQ